jgi:hypothetical protein
MYGSLEESTPAAAPALGPAEVKFVRKLMATSTGDDARPSGLLHEPQELSSWIARCARRGIQISTLIAANYIFPIIYAATRVACRRTGPRRRWPVDNLYCNLTTRRHRRALGLFHNLNLERRQVLGHDRLEGAASRMPS